MGKEGGIDRGVLYILTALVYLAIAGILLHNADWNPRTPNYSQYLVNTSGMYVSGAPYLDGYAFLANGEGNEGYFVVTDAYGEVRRFYVLEPRPAAAMLRKNTILFIFTEGNRMEIVAYDGDRFIPLTALSISWAFDPNPYPRIVDSPSALIPVRRGDISAKGVLYVSLEKNVFAPSMRVYFCRCSATYLYTLPDGSVVYALRGTPTLFSISGNGVRTTMFRSTPAVVPTDVCDGVFVGMDARRRLVWGKIGTDRFYEANISVDWYPVCRNNVALFTSSGLFSALAISEDLNEVASYLFSASNFVPVSVFDDPPYFIMAGTDSGNPEFVRNVVPGFKCPDTVYRVEENVPISVIPITFSSSSGVHWTTPSVADANAFVTIKQLSVDEDFRCYST